jgi:hypothetical protein
MNCPICNKELEEYNDAICIRKVCDLNKTFTNNHYDLIIYNDNSMYLKYIIHPFLVIIHPFLIMAYRAGTAFNFQKSENYSEIYFIDKQNNSKKIVELNYKLMLTKDNLEEIRAKLNCYLTFS